MKRNTLLLFAVLFILAIFGWAGWANWEYRQQAAERRLAMAAKGELIPSAAGDTFGFNTPLMNRPAPDFTLEDIHGNKVSLSSYKGKAVLLNFWATWCGPCKIETPWIIALRNKYASQGFEVLGISADDLDLGDKAKLKEEKQEIAQFAQQMHIPYPVLLNADSISKPYGGLDDLPTSFYIDRNGTIVAAQVGITSQDEIEGNIRKALESKN